ncbi:E3 ubiquitin/ISG15 ligase TRIM25-like [Lithobates pipiens]
MASADLRKDLECSICLKIYKYPVTLKCGHSFCRDCIGRVLDTQERSGGYSCPECRRIFKKHPVLQKNITLCKISETLQTTHGDQDKTGIFCTHCIHIPVPAVKFCLHCEASLCDNHLRVHSKSPEHILCDPTTSLENRKCPIHRKVLEYYCSEDSTCICVSCRLDGEHQGHQVETLDETSEKKKKKLRKVLQKLMREREKTDKRVQSLQEHRRKVQGKADGQTERVTALFRDLRRRLEDLEKKVLREISMKAMLIFISVFDVIRELKIKEEELSRKMGDIEKLCNMTDPLTVLQESDTGDLCDTEDADYEDQERHGVLLHDGGDLDVAGISYTLHTGLSDIMSGVNVQKCTGTHVYPHSTTKGNGHINASRKRLKLTPTVQCSRHQAGGSNIGAVQQTWEVLGLTDILLDVSTAGNHLHISDDRKTASRSDNSQNHPETSERFECPQVMSNQSFSSGRHYWEVDVGGAVYWRVGMCYPSIDRRGDHSVIGYNKKSWCLEGKWMCSNQYSVIHDSNRVPLPTDVPSNRVRIDLDYEAGRISFYDLCDPIRHLHTFITTFTEPLHAGVWLRGSMSCVKIWGESDVRNLPRDW